MGGAYQPRMQCVGTLSWSMAPFGVARKERAAQARVVREAPPKRQRERDARDGGQAGQEGPRAGMGNATPGAFATRQATRVEVSKLETEWSQVVLRCLNGDSAAWAEMVRTHHKRVYGLCYRFTGNATDAEDLTQDVFLKVYANLGSFDAGRGSLPVWITTMTRNLLVDNFRRTRNLRATSSLDEGWDDSEEFRPVDRLTAAGPSQHELAVNKELAKMVQEALAKVSVELREAVILRDLQDMDYKEIAQVLGIPEGTVKSRISRGRAELARLLERNKREVM
jgi:RNA polymerase sigma-70 factor, ECF subfamily